MTAATAAHAAPRSEVATVDGTPDLLAVYQRAQNHSADFRAARSDFRAAREAGPQARGQLLPKLNAGASYNRVHQEVEGEFLGAQEFNEDATFDSYNYGVTLTQPLFDRGAFVGLEQADVRIKRARLRLAQARNELRLKVARAYFGLLGAQDNLELARTEKRAIESQLSQTSDRFETGLTSDADYKAAQAQYDRAEANEIAARNSVAVARTRLEALTSAQYDDLRGLPDDAELPPPQPDRMAPWVNQAKSNNVAVLAQSAAARLARLRIDERRAQRWPSLDLVGSYVYVDQEGGFFDQEGGLAGANEDVDARIGVELNVPIYNGGMVSSRVREATEGLNSARARQDQQRAEAVQDTRSAFLGIKKALAEMRALERAVQSAESAEEATRVGYDVGTSTSAEVLSTVRDRFRAERDLTAARYEYMISSLKLKRASGSLSDRDLKQINRRLR